MIHLIGVNNKKCIYLRIPLRDGISLRVRRAVALVDCGQSTAPHQRRGPHGAILLLLL